jgi:hypothetical protein
MKKYLLIAAVLITSTAVQAQQEDMVLKGSKQTTMTATPKQIIDSLHKRFPNAESIDYYQTPALAAKNGWTVSAEDNSGPGAVMQYYTLSFKRSDFKYYALFKPDGTLVSSKYQENDANLPEAVTTAIKEIAEGDAYKDYTLYSKNYFKVINYGKASEYYEITGIKKTDNSKKEITMDPTGKIISATDIK